MKQLVKSYHVFLSDVWERWLVYLAYPLLFVAGNYMLVEYGLHPNMCVLFCSSMIITVELFFDLLVFGGIASRDTNKLEYLKTSVKGMKILEKSLVADGIRRVFSVTVILLSCYVSDSTDFKLFQFVMCVFSTLFLVELGLMVSRGSSVIGVVIALVVLLGTIAIPLTIIVLTDRIVSGSCLVLYVVVGVMGRVIIMKRARGSYYDNRDETRA